MIKLIADSTCNLPPDLVGKHDIRVAPVSIQFGEETYEEGIDIDRDMFYRKVDEMGIIPTTAQPTPAWFARHYEELRDRGHSALAITITSAHSGTYESAVLAKSIVPDADVEIFDTRSVSMGTGWMVLEAARAIEAGMDRPAVLDRLVGIRDRHFLAFTPATLKYLQMSGRVGRLQGALGSLLDLKPVILLENGVLEADVNVRTRGKALARMLDLAVEAVGTVDPVNVAVVHARAPVEAGALMEWVEGVFTCQETLVTELTASLAVHGGPGILMLTLYRI